MKKEKNAKKTIIPVGDRVTLKVPVVTKKDAEGNEFTDVSREAKVLDSNNDTIKKGMTVYYNPRGCINVDIASTNKYVILIVEACDIYGIVK